MARGPLRVFLAIVSGLILLAGSAEFTPSGFIHLVGCVNHQDKDGGNRLPLLLGCTVCRKHNEAKPSKHLE